MKDGRPSTESEPQRRRASDRSGSAPRKQRDYVSRATAQGHSGFGSESVRPHLQDQLRLKALMQMQMPYPLSEPQLLPGKDEHHR